MWDEWCPPSDASRLPGRPAVSQFEQMSMSIVKQSTQRKRAPTMSCWQLHPHQKKDTEVPGENHPLETLDAKVLDYPKGEGHKRQRTRHVLLPLTWFVRIVERFNAIRAFEAMVRSRRGLYQEWMDGMDVVHFAVQRCYVRTPVVVRRKLGYALVTGEANREIVAGGTFKPVTCQLRSTPGTMIRYIVLLCSRHMYSAHQNMDYREERQLPTSCQPLKPHIWNKNACRSSPFRLGALRRAIASSWGVGNVGLSIPPGNV